MQPLDVAASRFGAGPPLSGSARQWMSWDLTALPFLAVPWSFRRSKKLGASRIGVSRRGVSGSVGNRCLRLGASTTGRRSLSSSPDFGLPWAKTLRPSALGRFRRHA